MGRRIDISDCANDIRKEVEDHSELIDVFYINKCLDNMIDFANDLEEQREGVQAVYEKTVEDLDKMEANLTKAEDRIAELEEEIAMLKKDNEAMDKIINTINNL